MSATGETGPSVLLDPAGPSTAGTLFVCPLCGGRSTHGERACGACPFSRGCDVVRCGHCGYTYPRSSPLVSWVARRLGIPEARP